jgi:hypothetical protein
MTRHLCVIESQLTKQHDPIQHGWGTTGSCLSSPASFAVHVEHDSEFNPVASTVATLSLIPNRAALELLVRAAGFTRVDFLRAASHHNQQYVVGDRAVVVATGAQDPLR